MAEQQRIVIGEREIGDGRPCFVIAEAGINHNGDGALAAALGHPVVPGWVSFTEALAPTNCLLGNPAALRKALETAGGSLQRGAVNVLGDIAAGRRLPSHPHAPMCPHAVQNSQPSLWMSVALPHSGQRAPASGAAAVAPGD